MKKTVIFLLAMFYLFASIFSAGAILDLEDCGKGSNKPVSSPGSSSTVTASLVCYDSDSTDSTDSTVSDTSDEKESSKEINAFEVLEIFNDRIIALSQDVRASLKKGLLLNGDAIYNECNFTELTLNALFRDLERQPLERKWVAEFKSAFDHIHRVVKYPQLMREHDLLCESCKEDENGNVCKKCNEYNKNAACQAYKISKSLAYWEDKLKTTFQKIKESYWLKEYVKKKKSYFGRLL